MLDITIANLDRNASDGGVTCVHWRAFLSQDGITESACGCVNLTPDPVSSDFIAFDSLDEETVCDWVCAEVDITALEASLQSRIDEKLTPKTVVGLPW